MITISTQAPRMIPSEHLSPAARRYERNFFAPLTRTAVGLNGGGLSDHCLIEIADLYFHASGCACDWPEVMRCTFSDADITGSLERARMFPMLDEPLYVASTRSDQTSCRKDGPQSRTQAARYQTSWYCLSWRGLPSGASTPDDSRLNTPETTPPSIPTNTATAPRQK